MDKVELRKGEVKHIEAENRGGAKRFVTLIAIPSKALTHLKSTTAGKEESDFDLKQLYEEVKSKKIEGVIELVSHSFQRDVSEIEKAKWKTPVYRLQKDEAKGIKAELSKTNAVSFGFYPFERSFTPLAIFLMAGLGLVGLAVLFSLIWLSRKKRQNSV